MLALPLVFALLGFLFSTRKWLLFMDSLNPFTGLIIYYTIVTITIIVLEYFGLVIGGTKFSSISHTIGTVLIIFSFFIIFNWESCYVNYVTKGGCDNVSNVYLQSEDGALNFLFLKFFSQETSRILTYIVSPFVLTCLGMYLITDKVSLSIF